MNMRVLKKYQGYRPYRYKGNPLEREFALAWQAENRPGYRMLGYILSNGPNVTAFDVSERDEKVANTVIQWLGTPVGQGFLENVLRTKAGQTFIENRLESPNEHQKRISDRKLCKLFFSQQEKMLHDWKRSLYQKLSRSHQL